MKVLNFGSCNIDYVYTVSHFVNPGETISALDLNEFPGGKGLNQSVAISKSGVQVCHAGCIGSDGALLEKTLKDAGVDISHLKKTDKPTGHAIIQVNDDGENCIILYSGANSAITKEFIDEVIGGFDEGDIIVLQNEINNLEYIIDKAYERKMQIVLNPSPFHKSLTEIDLNKISYLMLNEVEAFEFSGKSSPGEICEFFTKKYEKLNVVLTLGSKGSIFFNKREFVKRDSFKVEAVDTTSAGDTFTGYFICGIVNGMPMEKILEMASVAAAIAVSKKGAAVSIPYISEVEKFLGKN